MANSRLLITLCAGALLTTATGISNGAPATQDTVKISETRSDKLTCQTVKDPDTGQKLNDCLPFAKGTYTITVKLIPATLSAKGIELASIEQGTPIEIQFGDFIFSDSFSSEARFKSTAKLRSAIWKLGHEVCALKDTECENPRTVNDTTITFTLNAKGAKLTIAGSSKEMTYGSSAYAEACANSAGGNLTDVGSLTIGQTVFSLNLDLVCSVSTKTVTKKDAGSFDLTTIKINGQLKI